VGDEVKNVYDDFDHSLTQSEARLYNNWFDDENIIMKMRYSHGKTQLGPTTENDR
jgi:hypothetical protein